jgi:hypothetical protein
VYDAGSGNTAYDWSKLALVWDTTTSAEHGDGILKVIVASSVDGTTWSPVVEVSASGNPLPKADALPQGLLVGRFLRINVQFTRSTAGSSIPDTSPVLRKLYLQVGPPLQSLSSCII